MAGTQRILRPDDLLVLEVELVGLAVTRTAAGPALEALPGAVERRLTFHLPPQHIAEEAYFDASPDGWDTNRPPTHYRFVCRHRGQRRHPVLQRLVKATTLRDWYADAVHRGVGFVPLELDY